MSAERLHLWSWEKPFHQWAGPGIERIFVALHPFMQVPGLKTNAHGYLNLKNVPSGHPAHEMAKAGKTGADGIASNHDTVLKSFGKARSWGWIAQAAGLEDAAHIVRAIDTLLDRAKPEFMDKPAANRLSAVVQKHDLLFPTEDYLSPMLEVEIGGFYKRLGIASVEIGNQMDDAAALVQPADFEARELSLIEADVPARAAYSHDEAMQLLTISDWCAHYSLICLSPEAVGKIDPSQKLEGFWADETTSADWPYADILKKQNKQARQGKHQKPKPKQTHRRRRSKPHRPQ